MSGKKRPRNHHWWPVGLQSYWTDKHGDVSWVEPSGKTFKKRAANRKIGFKIHGHTILRGAVWETNFEKDFDIDNSVHEIIDALNSCKPLGWTPSELVALLKLLFKPNRTLADQCKYYSLEEKAHRDLLLLIFSLLIRSPANRSRFESAPQAFGLPADEEVGKINMYHRYETAKKTCQTGMISNQYFVLLHSPLKKFVFGDGSLDWLTSALVSGRISGRALLPLTPYLCVFFCTPRSMRLKPNCASLTAAPWMVDWVNEIVQIYSKDKLFFLGKAPELTDAFRRGQFLEHKKKTDALIEMLEEVAGITKPAPIHGF